MTLDICKRFGCVTYIFFSLDIIALLPRNDRKEIRKYFEAAMDDILKSEWPKPGRSFHIVHAHYQNKFLNQIKKNWLKRSMLHLVAMFCHSLESLFCIPEEILKHGMQEKDIHGSTPYHIAYLHGNKAAIEFFKIHRAPDSNDAFEKSPSECSQSEIDLLALYRTLWDENTWLPNSLTQLLVLPAQECQEIENSFLISCFK